jgi:hypothetical protein
MHLPVGPNRSPGASRWGSPDPARRPVAGDRARLDQFRLQRELRAEDGPAYAARRLAALAQVGEVGREAARAGGGELGRRLPGTAWRPLGPFAIPHGRTAGSGPGSRPRVAGRVVAVAVDPGDPRHVLAGGGGLWESRDGGRTWEPRSDDQPTAAIGAVAFAPADPRVAYAGTGQGEALAALGVGLLRSEDGGATWRALVARELLGAGVCDLLVDPNDPARLLAATTAGLWASADGGHSWEPRLGGRSWAVSAGPGGEVLAGGELGLHRSEDGGATWRPVPLEAAPDGFDRVAVAHGPGGQVAYVFAAGDGVGHLWRREHAGGELLPVKPPPDLNSQQAWHSWACAADPGDPEVVWLGAAGLHRGARAPDGRWSWADLAARPAGDSLPPGQHAVEFEPGDPQALYVANEGGLYRSPDGGRSWRSLGTGLAVAEVDHLTDYAAWLLAGAGELGTLRYEGGEVWCPVGSADPAVVAGGELVAPGPDGLVVSADGGSAWTAVALPGVRGEVTALTAAGPDRLLAGTTEGELAQVERIGGTWTATGVARPRSGRVAGVATDPARPEVAWAAWRSEDGGATRTARGGGLVWRSGDGGVTWVEQGDGLPEVPVSGVAPDPERPGTVFAATDAGVWWSQDDGAGWRPLGGGLPNAPVLALAVRGADRLLRSGLLGRGVWELPLDGHTGPEAPTPALRPGRSPAARPRPGGPWWECPDVKLEVPPQPRHGPVEPVEFEDDRWSDAVGLPELGGHVHPGRPARVHVQVHHRGAGPLTNVQVRVLVTQACLRPPDAPTGPWTTGDGDPPPDSPWRPVGPPAFVGNLAPGRSVVASFDWQVPADLPRDVCLLAMATASEPTGGPARSEDHAREQEKGGDPTGAQGNGDDPAGGLWTSAGTPMPGGLLSPSGGPDVGGRGSGAAREVASRGAGDGGRGSGPPHEAGEVGGHPAAPVAVDPADLVAADGRWGLKSLTVLRPAPRVVRLDLRGSSGRGPFAVAAEGWVAELTAGLVLPGWLGDLAREQGLAADRVAEPWRPELVSLVREDPSLAGRVDLGAVFQLAAGRRVAGLEYWLRGMELAPDRAEPMLLLLREPPPFGRGSMLLLDVDGGVLGGHTFVVAH